MRNVSWFRHKIIECFLYCSHFLFSSALYNVMINILHLSLCTYAFISIGYISEEGSLGKKGICILSHNWCCQIALQNVVIMCISSGNVRKHTHFLPLSAMSGGYGELIENTSATLSQIFWVLSWIFVCEWNGYYL